MSGYDLGASQAFDYQIFYLEVQGGDTYSRM